MDLVFKALNDPHRRAILDALREADGQTLGEIEARLPMTRFGVMAHLRVLEEAGLVVPRRSGRFKHHFLNAVPLQEVLDRWIEPLLAKPAARAALDLKSRLETAMTDATAPDAKPDFVLATYIRCAPDALWAALTDPEQVARYHFVATGAQGRLGAPGDDMAFTMPDGSTLLATRVLSMSPPSRLEVDFRPQWGEDRAPSRVVYLVEPQGDACRLVIEHYGLPPAQAGVADGWARLASGLKSHLESGAPARFPFQPAA